MKKHLIKLNILGIALLSITTLAQQKNTSKKSNETKKNEQSVSDKKKALELEKSRLIKPYHPEENAEEKINLLVEKATKENKNIIIQAGGNWCIWCLRFNQFVQDTPELREMVDKKFLYYHLNWSPENKNTQLFEKYGNPGEKYGYPVFIILNKKGEMIHTQDSSVLEKGNSYSEQKVKEFFLKYVDASK